MFIIVNHLESEFIAVKKNKISSLPSAVSVSNQESYAFKPKQEMSYSKRALKSTFTVQWFLYNQHAMGLKLTVFIYLLFQLKHCKRSDILLE